jgi:hypothetical protein
MIRSPMSVWVLFWSHSSEVSGPASEAAGKRFLAVADGPTLSLLELAEILRGRLGPLAARVPAQEAPGEDPPRPIIRNDRAREELGWRPRPAEATIVQTAESLRNLGLLAQHTTARARSDPLCRARAPPFRTADDANAGGVSPGPEGHRDRRLRASDPKLRGRSQFGQRRVPRP